MVERLILHTPKLGDDDVDELPDCIVSASGVDRHRAGVAIRTETAEHRVREAPLFTDVLEQARAHRTAQHRIHHIAGITILVILPIARRAETDMALLEFLVSDHGTRNNP